MTDGATTESVDVGVTISAPGEYWVPHIVRELRARGATTAVYTTTPRFSLGPTLPTTTHTVLLPGLVKQVGYQLPRWGVLSRLTGWNRPVERWCNYRFDASVARRLRPAESRLFLGFAGACRDSLRRASQLGFVTAVERSSTHIRTQRRLLLEEYERHGVDGQPISLGHVEREEAEYDAADYVVTPSQFTYESFLDHGVEEEKLVRIPFGTDVGDAPPREESDERFTFLYVGHVSLRKGVQYLLPAWESLSLPNAELVVAGHVDDAVADLVAAYEGDDSVRFLGWVDDVETLFREASAFVFPSIEEGSARVTYEAMASGLPVVTTANSGWVGTDGEHGVEVPIRDPEAIADAMRRLYERPERRREMGRAGRELIASEYTWDDYGDRIYEAYRGMLSRSDEI